MANNRRLFADEYIKTVSGAGEIFNIPEIETGEKPALRFYSLDNVFLLGPGIVIGKDSIILKDSISSDTHIDAILARVSEGASHLDFPYWPIEGEFVSLLGPWCDPFWHWMMEYLPKAIIAEVFGFKGQYLISPTAAPYVIESLLLIGVAIERIVVFDHSGGLLISKLYMPERFTSESGMAYVSILRILRQHLLKNVADAVASPGRVYISRKFAPNGRSVSNESELTTLLDEFGFQAVLMEKMSLEEQIRLMANTTGLVGANGAGMFHSLLMPESSFVMELFSPHYTNIVMIGAMELLHHNYYMVTSVHNGNYTLGGGIEAPLRLIRATIRNCLHNGQL